MIEASEVFNVRMSPQHAKALAALLVHHVMGYEKQHNAELPLPPEIQGIWKRCVNEESKAGSIGTVRTDLTK